MQNGENNEVSASETRPPSPLTEVSKKAYRTQIWQHMQSNRLVAFPRPFNRVPNFKGSEEAAQRLSQLDIFKNAQNIKVNLDKPQEAVRLAVLESGKNLYVSAPRFKDGLAAQIVVPEQTKQSLKVATSHRGVETYGKKIGLDEGLFLDLVVVGSVAVAQNGDRIGKGKSFTSLEFALLMHMKAVNPNTIIVTTVDDCQVLESLPSELIEPHDIPVDVIVTPTQVIHTDRASVNLSKPREIIWSLVSIRRLAQLPVFLEIRDRELLSGRRCLLKTEESDVEEEKPSRSNRRRRVRQPKRQMAHSDSEHNEVSDSQNRGRRHWRKSSGRGGVSTEKAAADSTRPTVPPRFYRPKKPVLFSVKISNIEKSARLRDLKKALMECGVRPHVITWKGFNGYCYLHFAKRVIRTGEEDTGLILTVESVCEDLENMYIFPTAPEDSGSPQLSQNVPNKVVVEQAVFAGKQEANNNTADVSDLIIKKGVAGFIETETDGVTTV